MKEKIFVSAGTFGGALAAIYGGLSYSMKLLLVCMVVDWITGIITAGVFHKSGKTKNGRLESKAGFKGLCRKAIILGVVLVGHYVDLSLGINYVMTAVVFGFSANELVSILENLSLCGIKYPKIIEDALEILTEKSEHKTA